LDPIRSYLEDIVVKPNKIEHPGYFSRLKNAAWNNDVIDNVIMFDLFFKIILFWQ